MKVKALSDVLMLKSKLNKMITQINTTTQKDEELTSN